MSVAEKMRALDADERDEPGERLWLALPQIVAVVEAAERALPGPYVSDEGPALVPMERVVPLHRALAALDEALT